MTNIYNKKNSLLENKWKIKNLDERKTLMIAQKHNISPILAKLLTLRFIKDEEVENFLNPNFNNNIPDPFILRDMLKSIERTIYAIKNKQKIGIIADYDVDGSTSAAVLFNFKDLFCVCRFGSIFSFSKIFITDCKILFALVSGFVLL